MAKESIKSAKVHNRNSSVMVLEDVDLEQIKHKEHEILDAKVSKFDPRNGGIVLEVNTSGETSEAFLAAGIYVRSVKIVDTLLYGEQDLLLGFLVVDAVALLGESHAAVSKLRDLIAVSVFSVLHFLFLFVCPSRQARSSLSVNPLCYILLPECLMSNTLRQSLYCCVK
jgi:hypothetical protein